MNIHERTLVVVKPDGVGRGLVGEIVARFEKVGLRICGMKAVRIDEAHALKHYGQNEEWFTNVGMRVKEFYTKVGFDPGEEISNLSDHEIGKLVQKWNIDYMTEGLVIAVVLEGPHAVSVVRKLVGSTYPHEALPGTIRGDLARIDSPLVSTTTKRSVRNLVHASGTPKEAKFEIELWFREGELMESSK